MRRLFSQLLVLAMVSTVLSIAGFATTSATLGAQSDCFGSTNNDITTAKANYSNECGVTYSDSSGVHKCEWTNDGWRCQGPGTNTDADTEPASSPAAAPAPAPAPVSSADGTCFGSTNNDITTAKANYSNECGVTYSDSSGIHKCEWTNDGWRCQGPGTNTDNTPAPQPEAEQPAPVADPATNESVPVAPSPAEPNAATELVAPNLETVDTCLLYTSDAADE